MSNNKELEKLIFHLNLKDQGELKYFKVKQVVEGFHLSQRKYINNLLKKAKMNNANPLPTPMISGFQLSSQKGHDLIKNAHEYMGVVGGLQHITVTRPKIAFNINKLCQSMQRPWGIYWKAVKRILRYLKGTIGQGIIFRRSNTLNLTCFSNEDWGNDVDHRSTIGFCIFLSNNIVFWCSKKQQMVSRSNIESEYRSLANAASKLIWIQSLLIELKIKQNTSSTVWCDNLSTIALSENPILHSKTKYKELYLHFVQEKMLQKELVVKSYFLLLTK